MAALSSTGRDAGVELKPTLTITTPYSRPSHFISSTPSLRRELPVTDITRHVAWAQSCGDRVAYARLNSVKEAIVASSLRAVKAREAEILRQHRHSPLPAVASTSTSTPTMTARLEPSLMDYDDASSSCPPLSPTRSEDSDMSELEHSTPPGGPVVYSVSKWTPSGDGGYSITQYHKRVEVTSHEGVKVSQKVSVTTTRPSYPHNVRLARRGAASPRFNPLSAPFVPVAPSLPRIAHASSRRRSLSSLSRAALSYSTPMTRTISLPFQPQPNASHRRVPISNTRGTVEASRRLQRMMGMDGNTDGDVDMDKDVKEEVVAIYFYSYYVFVVRVCVPMVRMESGRLGDSAQGIAYLVIYHILFIMFVWTYAVAIVTPPGFAKDYVPQTEPPREKAELVQVQGYRFEDQPESSSRRIEEHDDEDYPGGGAVGKGENRRSSGGDWERDTSVEERIESETGVDANCTTTLTGSGEDSSSPTNESFTSTSFSNRPSASDTTFLSKSSQPPVPYPPKAHTRTSGGQQSAPPRASRSSTTRSFLHFPQPPEDYEPPKMVPLVERIPTQVPVLTEDYRYDFKEGFVRPYRSHRCKHCASVVLNNFLQWSSLYTTFLVITLIIANTRPLHRPRPSVDGQQIAIIILAGLFCFFTVSLFTAHTRLIMLNITTIEDMGMSRMKARERSALQRAYGFWRWREKRRAKKVWDQQWGRIGKEGNLWWLGSSRANWEMVMGKDKLGWFLPIPASPKGDDGLSYVPNPRFSKEGLWRMRAEWPAELR
ncbi:vacuole protein, palmitoyltransferase domain containing [Pseudohyphozyma bogoriensis]|nr:vacuole protein, palmitoyltransferase domain containing [Pseudohyphozyma bogoriensis]